MFSSSIILLSSGKEVWCLQGLCDGAGCDSRQCGSCPQHSKSATRHANLLPTGALEGIG